MEELILHSSSESGCHVISTVCRYYLYYLWCVWGVSVGVDGLVSIGMVMAMNSNVCTTTTITVNTALNNVGLNL